LHLHEFVPHLIHRAFQSARLFDLRDGIIFFAFLFGLPIDEPPLDVTHAFLERANVSNGPFLEFLEAPGDDKERTGGIKRALLVELSV